MAKKKYTRDTARLLGAVDELVCGGPEITMKDVRKHIAFLRDIADVSTRELLAAVGKYLEATCGPN